MKKIFLTILITTAFSASSLVVNSQTKSHNTSLQWEHIAKGFDFVEFEYGKWFKKGHIYAIKLDKSRKLRLLMDKSSKSTSLKDLEEKYNTMAVINGGYFQENFSPAGLLKINNKIIAQLNKSGSSGILGIKDNQVNIFHKKEINTYKSSYNELMQNGPLLVENNGKMGIYNDDHEYGARTVVGITKDDKVLIAVADSTAAPSLWEMAELLTKGEDKGGFSCKIAINMDGGSSTGLRINLPNKKLTIDESAYIANGIGIF